MLSSSNKEHTIHKRSYCVPGFSTEHVEKVCTSFLQLEHLFAPTFGGFPENVKE